MFWVQDSVRSCKQLFTLPLINFQLDDIAVLSAVETLTFWILVPPLYLSFLSFQTKKSGGREGEQKRDWKKQGPVSRTWNDLEKSGPLSDWSSFGGRGRMHGRIFCTQESFSRGAFSVQAMDMTDWGKISWNFRSKWKGVKSFLSIFIMREWMLLDN